MSKRKACQVSAGQGDPVWPCYCGGGKELANSCAACHGAFKASGWRRGWRRGPDYINLCSRCGQRWNIRKREPPTEAAALFYVSLLGSNRAIKEVDKEYRRYLLDHNMSGASRSSSADAEPRKQSTTPAPADPAPGSRLAGTDHEHVSSQRPRSSEPDPAAPSTATEDDSDDLALELEAALNRRTDSPAPTAFVNPPPATATAQAPAFALPALQASAPTASEAEPTPQQSHSAMEQLQGAQQPTQVARPDSGQANSPSSAHQAASAGTGQINSLPLHSLRPHHAAAMPQDCSPPRAGPLPHISLPQTQPPQGSHQHESPQRAHSIQHAPALPPSTAPQPQRIAPKSSWLIGLPSAPSLVQAPSAQLRSAQPQLHGPTHELAAADPQLAWPDSMPAFADMDNSFVPPSFLESLTPSPTAAGIHAALLSSSVALPPASLGPGQLLGFPPAQLEHDPTLAQAGLDPQSFSLRFPDLASTPEAPRNRLKRILPSPDSFGSPSLQQAVRSPGSATTPRSARAARLFHSYVHTVKTDELGRWSLWWAVTGTGQSVLAVVGIDDGQGGNRHFRSALARDVQHACNVDILRTTRNVEVEQWLDKIGAHVPAGNSAILKASFQARSPQDIIPRALVDTLVRLLHGGAAPGRPACQVHPQPRQATSAHLVPQELPDLGPAAAFSPAAPPDPPRHPPAQAAQLFSPTSLDLLSPTNGLGMRSPPVLSPQEPVELAVKAAVQVAIPVVQAPAAAVQGPAVQQRQPSMAARQGFDRVPNALGSRGPVLVPEMRGRRLTAQAQALQAQAAAVGPMVPVPGLPLDLLQSKDALFNSVREDTGRHADGRRFKNFYVVNTTSHLEHLGVQGLDEHDRRYRYTVQPEFGTGTLENIPAVYDWLHANVLGKTGTELQQLRAPSHAAVQIQQLAAAGPPNKRARVGRPSLHPSRRAAPAAVQPHGFPAAHARAMARAASAAQAQPQAAASQLPPAPEEAPQAADTAMSAEEPAAPVQQQQPGGMEMLSAAEAMKPVLDADAEAVVAGHPSVRRFVALAISLDRWKAFKSHVQVLNRAAKQWVTAQEPGGDRQLKQTVGSLQSMLASEVTLQMLFSCSVLASCMRLTEHPQDEVSNTAKATIKHWRSQALEAQQLVQSAIVRRNAIAQECRPAV